MAGLNAFDSREFVKKCFIMVQRGSSAVFIGVYARLIRLFHNLFNKTVENLARANCQWLL
jgi:hypothetical protein